MRHISEHNGQHNRVTAVLEAGVFSFNVSLNTTLGELASRLVDLGERHREALLSIGIAKSRDATGYRGSEKSPARH